MISIRREILNPTKKKTRKNGLNAYDISLCKARKNNESYHDASSYKCQIKEKIYILCRIIRESMEID